MEGGVGEREGERQIDRGSERRWYNFVYRTKKEGTVQIFIGTSSHLSQTLSLDNQALNGDTSDPYIYS